MTTNHTRIDYLAQVGFFCSFVGGFEDIFSHIFGGGGLFGGKLTSVVLMKHLVLQTLIKSCFRQD